jgi:hypothetical protein
MQNPRHSSRVFYLVFTGNTDLTVSFFRLSRRTEITTMNRVAIILVIGAHFDFYVIDLTFNIGDLTAS